MGWFGNGSDSLRMEMGRAGLEGLAKGERSKLADDFGVCGGKGNGVVARVKRGGNVPEQRRW